jgi:predicted Zn finger-like uncharacterized protein
MYIQCPECLSVFSLDAQTLAQARGQVVCGHCGTGFDSLDTLTGQLPAEPFRDLAINEAGLAPPVVDLAVYRPRPDPPATIDDDVDVAAAAAAAEHRPAADDFSQLVFTPRFARQQQRRRRERAPRRVSRATGERRWPWIVAGLALALLLALQLAWAERDWLIRNPTTGNWLRHTCATLGCDLPLVAAPDQIQLLASNVQAHPTVKGALMISASVRNAASFAQPYPVITLTLSDPHGQRLMMRRLQPRDYLDDATVRQRGLAPGAQAALLMEIEDPGKQAVAFEFDFE